jgi:nucleotide-binding universal stress UspA family protein
MKMIKKILVATDGSEASKHAVNFAVDLAEQTSAEIQLLTVVPPPLLPSYNLYVVKSKAIKECANELEAIFWKILAKSLDEVKKKSPKLKVSTKLRIGEPHKKIVQSAKLGNFDLIVMGSRGLDSRFAALGSVSSRVIDRAPCPVVVTR